MGATLPKFVYYEDGRAVRVEDAAAEAALAPGWAESPVGPFPGDVASVVTSVVQVDPIEVAAAIDEMARLEAVALTPADVGEVPEALLEPPPVDPPKRTGRKGGKA